MLQRTVSTGCNSLDRFLEGGFPINSVTLVYGEAETGKTTLAIQCAVNCARMGLKTIFIDSDGTFSVRRLSQIAHQDFEEISPYIVLMRPVDFKEQTLAINELDRYLTEKVGLVVVDTITSLYRAELGEGTKKIFMLNRELNRQVACLVQVAKTRKTPVFMTSQVRNVLLEGHVVTEPVATRVVKFWSDIVIKLKSTAQANVIKAMLEKHPRHSYPLNCYLMLDKTGIHDYKHKRQW